MERRAKGASGDAAPLEFRGRFVHGLLAALVLAAACAAFEDWTPEEISFEMTGAEGLGARVVYSTEFSAGVDIGGVTSVLVYASDTVDHTLPIDTSMSIARDQQWLVLVEPAGGDTLEVDVSVSVDDRSLVVESGSILPETPWRYLYVFNQRITRDVEVRF